MQQIGLTFQTAAETEINKTDHEVQKTTGCYANSPNDDDELHT